MPESRGWANKEAVRPRQRMARPVNRLSGFNFFNFRVRKRDKACVVKLTVRGKERENRLQKNSITLPATLSVGSA